jgi:hypothetical protein
VMNQCGNTITCLCKTTVMVCLLHVVIVHEKSAGGGSRRTTPLLAVYARIYEVRVVKSQTN